VTGHCGGADPSETKEETTPRVRAGDVEAPASLGSLPAPTERRICIVCILWCVIMWKIWLMVMHLDWLVPCEGTARNERPYGGSSWRVNTVKTEIRGGMWDRSQTSQTQPSEEKKWRYACRPLGANCLKKGAMWRTDKCEGPYFPIFFHASAFLMGPRKLFILLVSPQNPHSCYTWSRASVFPAMWRRLFACV
jgi:hypothetical protein